MRATLDIRAFGCNAYVAGEEGEDVVEPHTEEGDDHQELYFVARGQAEFTLDGERFDAPAGTYVFIPDPGIAPPCGRGGGGHDGPQLRRPADVRAVGMGGPLAARKTPRAGARGVKVLPVSVPA